VNMVGLINGGSKAVIGYPYVFWATSVCVGRGKWHRSTIPLVPFEHGIDDRYVCRGLGCVLGI
jgi:hypothetical protein